ncbi:MAG TPA: NAD(P)/FAD-dependent oxidoreductase [Acidimicrobiales bacterium]|nr:NAD(P)/FAD-dependent oxidoreductase [Acidimicrobiales bacterium]
MAARDLRYAVIGAGMAGILTAVKLQDAGIDEFTVYEKADRVGGTWRENTYPGLSCDVPSHLYCYSFALNPGWSHVLSPGPEILAYFESVAERYGVAAHTRFSDEVVSCEFDDGRWHLTTASGHRDTVDVVIAATGVLHHPRYPDIEGLDSFGGAMFHSARWDHSVPTAGRRVGVIGTGSTAVQIVTAVTEEASHLSMFQRTAQWIMPAPNPAYTDEELSGFREPGALEKFHAELSDMFDLFSTAVVDVTSPMFAFIESACLRNLEDNVADPDLRERLRPSYRAACKRLIVSEGFYEAIQRPNAELVTDHIERIEPGGVRTADGRLHELDVLVLATGFQVDAFVRPIRVRGRGGIELDDVWAKRPEAYLAISVPEFPNFFMLNGPNGPVGNFSLIEVAELQLGYIMQLVDRLGPGGRRQVCATADALAAFESARIEASKNTVWATGCDSWYLDDRGIPAAWPWPFKKFREEMAAPDWGAYELVD